ncbi:MAG: glycosyl hydrolase, partial [Vicinamibacteria bacterium]
DATRHIGRIVAHPEDERIAYVAALGSLWGPSSERGIYRTGDRGASWERVLFISENTGVSDVAMDPRNPEVLYAAAYQRRRHDFAFIGGGPESGIYRTLDGGKSWERLSRGLPAEDMGRIGIAVAPSDPDVLYATVGARRAGGLYRTKDRGETWELRSSYNPVPWFYSQVRVDPKDQERVYVLGDWLSVSADGGKTFESLGREVTHADHHALIIDPDDPERLLLGNDGGIYFSHDRGQNWDFMSHLPICQFYTVAVDDRRPFYRVYGGTQDNQTLGGPSRTWDKSGITNGDWQVVTGGDGFYVQVDPTDPRIVYGEAQYGELVRFNTETGERLGIQPRPAPGEPEYRWNWSAPLLISPHEPATLYFAANRVFKSEDGGNRWEVASPDLTRGLDPRKVAVMGKVWEPETTVAYNEGIARYGNVSSLDESSLTKGLLYVGTDDGLIQVSRDAGNQWMRVEDFPAVPEGSYVSRVLAGRHAVGTVYATFNNQRRDDLRAYVLKSTDYGATWASITSNLAAEPVHVIREHPRDPNLLFVGTELGAWVSGNGGGEWVRFSGGLPTVPVYDIAIQERENDVILATHGRGFWILDDASPLERAETTGPGSVLFPVRNTALFHVTGRLGFRPGGAQGNRYFMGRNPDFGALITYALDREPPEDVTISIMDESGAPIMRIPTERHAGVHRIAWDLAYPTTAIADHRPRGLPHVLPGTFQAALHVGDQEAGRVSFQVEAITGTDPGARRELTDFLRRLDLARGRTEAAVETAERIEEDLKSAEAALDLHPSATRTLREKNAIVLARTRALLSNFRGTPPDTDGNIPPEEIERTVVLTRLEELERDLRLSSDAPTDIHERDLAWIENTLMVRLSELKTIVEVDLAALHAALDVEGVPWTPGRFPR